MGYKATGFHIEQVIQDADKIMTELALDTHELLFDDVLDAYHCEEWEVALDKKRVPYVTVYGYVKGPGVVGPRTRVNRGYLILLRKSDIYKHFSFNSVEGSIERRRV